jgi:hypothetical protein
MMSWKVTILPLILPFLIYTLSVNLLTKRFAEISSFGALLGIISLVNTGTSVKVVQGITFIVKESTGTLNCRIVCMDTSITVGDLRDRIAQALDLSSTQKVFIESGRGQYIDNYNAPLLSILTTIPHHDSSTITLRITITDVMETKNTNQEKQSNSFFNMLNSKENIRYGSDVQMSARITSSQIDMVSFTVSSCNSFGAASPHHVFPALPFTGGTIRFQPYIENRLRAESDTTVSEVDPQKAPSLPQRSRSNEAKEVLILAVRNFVKDGDELVLESDGKYMSLAKGWWLAWSSDSPRRSGAFKVEITDRASKNKLSESISKSMKHITETIKESAFGKKDGPEAKVDELNLLRSGDSFRLRSIKFPEYELGVTSVKIKDNFCYLGLRKVYELLSLYLT